ncbi:MAG: ABC transporter permease [Pseudomonadota bacterium]
MRFAIFCAMALTLIRDRAGLAMAFILPPLVFLIFAVIFSAASGGDLDIRVAVVDELKSPQSERLVDRLLADRRLIRVGLETGADSVSADDVVGWVRSGAVDVGIMIRKDARPLDDISQSGAAPIAIIVDPARSIASSIVEGILQEAFFSAIPEAAIRSVADQIDKRIAPFSPEQRARVARGLTAMGRARVPPETNDTQLSIDRVLETRNAVSARNTPIAVTYYAGAVTIMFLLFSSLTGALSLLEERESGLLDRLVTSPGGPGIIVDGKFLFLVLQGLIQATIIFVVAWLGFGVALPAHMAAWLATSFATAIAASGLALAFVSMCRTRQQAHTLGQMGIVVLAAVGGSMVPRYLMPQGVQDVGWATPTTWAIEAYAAIFHRGEPVEVVLPFWMVLFGSGIAGLIVARIFVRRTV